MYLSVSTESLGGLVSTFLPSSMVIVRLSILCLLLIGTTSSSWRYHLNGHQIYQLPVPLKKDPHIRFKPALALHVNGPRVKSNSEPVEPDESKGDKLSLAKGSLFR